MPTPFAALAANSPLPRLHAEREQKMELAEKAWSVCLAEQEKAKSSGDLTRFEAAKHEYEALAD
jgi:hypothetical protein